MESNQGKGWGWRWEGTGEEGATYSAPPLSPLLNT